MRAGVLVRWRNAFAKFEGLKLANKKVLGRARQIKRAQTLLRSSNIVVESMV